jgi:ribosomal protein S12 methylthiotransferase
MDRANPGGYLDPDQPSAVRGERLAEDKRPAANRQPPTANGPTAVLRLSEGCSHPCSFCVIPRLRGPVQSRSAETILREARELAAQGIEEFSVIAQDTGDWGRDFRLSSSPATTGGGPIKAKLMGSPPETGGNDGKKGLPQLLRSVAAIPGVRWIRLMYMHPASFTDELLDVMTGQPDKFPYLDMPFQHIDTDVLAEMKRKTDETDLRNLLDRIHARAPALTLRTTFIVGFPGETAAQFKRLVNFIQEGHFDYLGAFAYSKEEGTPAAKRNDQISDKVKQDRLAILTNAYYDVAHAKAQRRLGTVETVLLEDTESDTVLGRTRREAPEIDAVVRLPQAAARRASLADRRASRGGRFVSAKLTGYDAYEFSAIPA